VQERQVVNQKVKSYKTFGRGILKRQLCRIVIVKFYTTYDIIYEYPKALLIIRGKQS
jgi:hypothetical protein